MSTEQVNGKFERQNVCIGYIKKIKKDVSENAGAESDLLILLSTLIL